MDKNAIKKFAVWARRELISRVSQRAAWYGITEKDPIDEKTTVFHGKVLSENEQAQRRALIARIRTVGFQQVMEEVAYTWFNRFIALRFMEVNGYLPSYTRVFSDDNGTFNPQILKDAIHLNLDGLDMEKVYALEEADETEALFKYLVITQCNDLNRMLPAMFERIADYTELLFPDFLLREGSVAHQMVTTIPEEDWKDAVQIIGWLYQYYNAEPKDEVFAALKKNIKISKEKIPAATQLFTPDWIVRYMVENSLGRLWVEGHPNEELKAGWKYYLEEAPQEPEVEAQLATIRAEYAQIDPTSILCADPCMGSGHILVYLFDVLMQIYLAYGYTTNEAVESIVRNNLWGLDIDDRAAQLAYFAVMMKAQQYDHRWLAKQVSNPAQPHVFALQDSGDWTVFETQMQQAFANHPTLFADAALKTAKKLFDTFADAKEYGSIIQPDISLDDLSMLETVLNEMQQKANLMDFAAQADAITLIETLKPLILECKALVQKYYIVVTNPPYMGGGTMCETLDAYVRTYYPDSKSDLYTVFIERCNSLCRIHAFTAMITQHSWMFLTTYESLRKSLLCQETLINMSHLGPRAFDEISGEIVQTTSFVLMKGCYSDYQSTYKRLVNFCNESEKELAFHDSANTYHSVQKNFDFISGSPIGYWVTPRTYRVFEEAQTILDVATPKQGFATTDNTYYLRMWYEVDRTYMTDGIRGFNEDTGTFKWVPYNKGGPFVKWYGDLDYVCLWADCGRELKENKKSVLRNPDYQFRKCITWSLNNFGSFGARERPAGSLFDTNGMSLFADGELHEYLLAFLCSKLAAYFMSIYNPTMSSQVGDIAKLPVIVDNTRMNRIVSLVNECISSAKESWDSFETSWDFHRHPLLEYTQVDERETMTIRATPNGEDATIGTETYMLIDTAYHEWSRAAENRFNQLKANEEELNRIFIDTYSLQKEISPEVDDKNVTVRKADLGRDIRSFISYAVGCMFGRYHIGKNGLQFAGGNWNDYVKEHQSELDFWRFAPDKDGILPITDDEYFDDDIVGYFCKFVEVAYGKNTLEENLAFIAKALGGSGSSRDVIRQYFLNDFYKDHLKIYQKRPIYWLFDSGKKDGFKCLIYMHRYQPDTIARIRTDYLHETQARYRNAIETLERQSANASTSERVKMTKRLTALKAQAEEARVYEEKIHHLADQMIRIDLDDGVKVNYAKFADVLAPIK